MTRKQAMTEAKKRWGKRAAIRFEPRKATKGVREQASADLKTHRLARPPKEEWKTEDSRRWRARDSQLMGLAMSYRYEVGRIGPDWLPCFEIFGQGDSWEEAFAYADRRKLMVG
jgi:hypothetical protein